MSHSILTHEILYVIRQIVLHFVRHPEKFCTSKCRKVGHICQCALAEIAQVVQDSGM